jgi:hypothetical protein
VRPKRTLSDYSGAVHARTTRNLVIAALACVALLATPAAALADGDPASDVLPLQDVYLPYSPPVSAPVANALRTVLSAARRTGHPIKVAIIATPTDLGAVPNMFGQPQQYASFLGSEISFNAKNPLLVVMPAGYGGVNLPAGTTQVVQGLRAPGSGDSDTLARSAIAAVVALARASGHPVATPKIAASSGGHGGGTSPAVVFGAPVALLVLAGVLMTIRRRTASTRPDAAAGTPATREPPPDDADGSGQPAAAGTPAKRKPPPDDA